MYTDVEKCKILKKIKWKTTIYYAVASSERKKERERAYYIPAEQEQMATGITAVENKEKKE